MLALRIKSMMFAGLATMALVTLGCGREFEAVKVRKNGSEKTQSDRNQSEKARDGRSADEQNDGQNKSGDQAGEGSEASDADSSDNGLIKTDVEADHVVAPKQEVADNTRVGTDDEIIISEDADDSLWSRLNDQNQNHVVEVEPITKAETKVETKEVVVDQLDRTDRLIEAEMKKNQQRANEKANEMVKQEQISVDAQIKKSFRGISVFKTQDKILVQYIAEAINGKTYEVMAQKDLTKSTDAKASLQWVSINVLTAKGSVGIDNAAELAEIKNEQKVTLVCQTEDCESVNVKLNVTAVVDHQVQSKVLAISFTAIGKAGTYELAGIESGFSSKSAAEAILEVTKEIQSTQSESILSRILSGIKNKKQESNQADRQ